MNRWLSGVSAKNWIAAWNRNEALSRNLSSEAFGGQYLYVAADLATIKMPAYDESDCQVSGSYRASGAITCGSQAQAGPLAPFICDEQQLPERNSGTHGASIQLSIGGA